VSFEEFFGRHEETLRMVNARAAAESVWDAALCAAQDAMFDRGRMRDSREAHRRISELHTWVKEEQVSE